MGTRSMVTWYKTSRTVWTKRLWTIVLCSRWHLPVKLYPQIVSTTICLMKRINRVFISSCNGKITGDACICPTCCTSCLKHWYVITKSLGNSFLFDFQINEFYNGFFFSKFVSCREKKNQRNVFLRKLWFKDTSKLPTGGFAIMLLPPYTERYALLRLISLQFQMRDVPIIILFYTITSNAEFGIINKICDVPRENDDSKK